MPGIFPTTRNLFCATKRRGRALADARAQTAHIFFSRCKRQPPFSVLFVVVAASAVVRAVVDRSPVPFRHRRRRQSNTHTHTHTHKSRRTRWAIVPEAANRAATNIDGDLATKNAPLLGTADAFSTVSSRAALKRQRPAVHRSGLTDLAICPTSWWSPS